MGGPELAGSARLTTAMASSSIRSPFRRPLATGGRVGYGRGADRRWRRITGLGGRFRGDSEQVHGYTPLRRRSLSFLLFSRPRSRLDVRTLSSLNCRPPMGGETWTRCWLIPIEPGVAVSFCPRNVWFPDAASTAGWWAENGQPSSPPPGRAMGGREFGPPAESGRGVPLPTSASAAPGPCTSRTGLDTPGRTSRGRPPGLHLIGRAVSSRLRLAAGTVGFFLSLGRAIESCCAPLDGWGDLGSRRAQVPGGRAARRSFLRPPTGAAGPWTVGAIGARDGRQPGPAAVRDPGRAMSPRRDA